MKNIYLFLCLAIIYCIATPSAAQYLPFPNGKAVWRNFERMTSPNYPKLAIWYYQSGADTLINSSSYKKIYKVSKVDPKAQNDTVYAAAIREDQATQKIWIVPAGATEDKLLYDYDIKLGDKITGWYNIDRPISLGSYFKVVTITDGFSYYDGAIKRRIFTLEGYNSNNDLFSTGSLIAGIGFSSGFLNNPSLDMNYGYNREICFSDDEKDIRKECYTEPIVVGNSSSIDQEVQALILYPNPAQDLLQIGSNLFIIRIVVYQSNGIKVIESYDTQNLDVSQLSRGLYLLEAMDLKGMRLLKKFEKR